MNNKVNAKIVMLGKEFGGKTSLVERFLRDKFCGDTPYQNTIGAAYGAKRVEAFGRYVVLGVWDTAGSERYQAMSRIYYRDAWAAVVCYDPVDAASWEKVKFWVDELRTNEPSCRIYLCATKRDLVDADPDSRKVSSRELLAFSKTVGCCDAFETSSKTGENVEALFLRIARDFVKDSKESSRNNTDADDVPGERKFRLDSLPKSARSCTC